MQQKAALSLCRSSLWFSLRLSRPPSKDYQPRSCKEGSSLSVGRHSSSRCDSQDLPRRTTSRGRATEGSSLSLSVVTLVLAATLKTCLEGLTTSRGRATLSFLFLGRNPNKLLSGCKLKEESQGLVTKRIWYCPSTMSVR